MRNQTGMKGITLTLIIVVCLAMLLGINVLTAPVIEQNGSAQQFQLLYDAMPEASGFELIYDAADSASSALTDVPGTVTSIYAETAQQGYVLRLSTTGGYTGEPMELTLAVNAEGRISGVVLTAYPETKDFGRDTYPLSYVGQDSTLADAALVAGVTYSSSAFRGAVNDGFAALIGNNLISAGQKSDEQLLMELAAVVYPGLVNKAGALQSEEFEGGGAHIRKSLRALNGSGCAYLLADDDGANYLGLCNAAGGCAIYNVKGAAVTGKSALEQEIAAATQANLASFAEKDAAKLLELSGVAGETAPLELGTFNTVTDAFTITGEDGTVLYGFTARSYGYNNLVMTVYYVLDENGAIVAMNADELIFYGEYFTDYTLDKNQYKAAFAGLTGESWTGETAIISGATASTVGVTQATEDVFEVFELVRGGEGA